MSAMQAKILKADFFYINIRNQTKKAPILDRHRIRFFDVGFYFLTKFRIYSENFGIAN